MIPRRNEGWFRDIIYCLVELYLVMNKGILIVHSFVNLTEESNDNDSAASYFGWMVQEITDFPPVKVANLSEKSTRSALFVTRVSNNKSK